MRNRVTETNNTWKRIGIPDESDVWLCPDCEWAMLLEPLDSGEDAPVEHGYKYCPHCGERRIYGKE